MDKFIMKSKINHKNGFLRTTKGPFYALKDPRDANSLLHGSTIVHNKAVPVFQVLEKSIVKVGKVYFGGFVLLIGQCDDQSLPKWA